MHLDIAVTQADIYNGIKGDCNCCPVALAVKRAGGLAVRVSQEIEADFDGDLHSFGIPPELVAFITAFDDGRDVEPISCTLVEC